MERGISPGGRGGLIPNCPEWIPWWICSAASNRGWTGSCGSGRRAPIPAGRVPQALWAVSLSEARCELLILTFISLLKGESWESLGAWSLLSNGWTKKVEKNFYRIMEYPEWNSQTWTSPLAQAETQSPPCKEQPLLLHSHLEPFLQLGLCREAEAGRADPAGKDHPLPDLDLHLPILTKIKYNEMK